MCYPRFDLASNEISGLVYRIGRSSTYLVAASQVYTPKYQYKISVFDKNENELGWCRFQLKLNRIHSNEGEVEHLLLKIVDCVNRNKGIGTELLCCFHYFIDSLLLEELTILHSEANAECSQFQDSIIGYYENRGFVFGGNPNPRSITGRNPDTIPSRMINFAKPYYFNIMGWVKRETL